ncbi:sugar kinase [Salipaludibacillus aurantiacus]|uniref:2-dehydro-3-deoxygluconokinase n=1 Tax=Salipaludibacillus aurantiacus TaxID=1601833 RepID=A0A1H9UBI0_9BACI|nr:sugar kinase [Salipaludibacillus aurantiacus]SES06453.1 2-dehydro-3-deoxygluconokinase [Salipaludibacillus aurantiacus]
MTAPEVITIGETMVIFNPDQSLPLEYAHSFTKQIGGAESNVAVGLSRLGHKAGWISRVGSDPFGYYIQQVIRGEGVDTSLVTMDDKAPTGVFFKERKTGDSVNVYYYRAHSAASQMTEEDLDRDYFKNAEYVVVSGILPALSASCRKTTDKVIQIAKDLTIPIVFDPNVRMKLWKDKDEAASVLNDIAAQSDVILIGDAEGHLLTGTNEPAEIADFYKRLAPGTTVVVKLGAEGAYYSNGEESAFVSGFPVSKVVDPIGAGDSFAAGFISAQLRGLDLYSSVRMGNAAGAITVQVSGDIEGFPRSFELEKMLQSAEKENYTDDVNR